MTPPILPWWYRVEEFDSAAVTSLIRLRRPLRFGRDEAESETLHLSRDNLSDLAVQYSQIWESSIPLRQSLWFNHDEVEVIESLIWNRRPLQFCHDKGKSKILQFNCDGLSDYSHDETEVGESSIRVLRSLLFAHDEVELESPRLSHNKLFDSSIENSSIQPWRSWIQEFSIRL